MKYIVTLFLLCCAGQLQAEQFQQIGQYQAHYIVVPTTFIRADVAQKYGLMRGKNRALVNVSVLDAKLNPTTAQISGRSTNLLGQPQDLTFKQVTEGPAIYYLALLRHVDEEHHLIKLDIALDDGTTGTIEFRQKMYFEE
ncbi:MAG: DUF4426 domain-containing protein [Pseudomonadota bacterium]